MSLPSFFAMSLPIEVSSFTQGYYDALEATPDGSTVAMQCSLYGEFYPQVGSAIERTITILWKKDCKIMFFTIYPENVPFVDIVIEGAKKLMPSDKTIKYGEDYVQLGLITGLESGISALASDIHGTIPNDKFGNNIDDLPMMQDVNTGADFTLLAWMGTGTGTEDWGLRQWQGRFGTPMVDVGVTMMQPTWAPYIESGQIAGGLYGLRGSAELEPLSNLPGPGIGNTNTLSIGCLVVIFFIIFGNIVYYYGKVTGREN